MSFRERPAKSRSRPRRAWKFEGIFVGSAMSFSFVRLIEIEVYSSSGERVRATSRRSYQGRGSREILRKCRSLCARGALERIFSREDRQRRADCCEHQSEQACQRRLDRFFFQAEDGI